MAKLKVVMVLVLILGCGTPSILRENTDALTPLPDLRIKKIEYRQEHRQQLLRRSNRDPTIAKLEYRFTLLIENTGDTTFAEPFYLSVSGSLGDFQDRYYSRHLRLNDEQQLIGPGQTIPFVVSISLDFPPPSTRMSHYPVRFYLNTEGSNNSTGYPTLYVAERSYKNNFYELQIRL